jgi:DNA primase
VNRQALDDLKQRISLFDYLRAQDWQPIRRLPRNRWMGLCPLHSDHKPSFLLDPVHGLFYCYGCGRGGDIIRFVELYEQVSFPQALAALLRWHGFPSVLHAAVDFYRMQLHRHGEAPEYLFRRGIRSPDVIEHMGIGYAPGGCLRRELAHAGYPLATLREAGLVNASGYDSFMRRIVFPLEGNLYGRSISATAPPHRLLPGTKGGLYRWEEVRGCAEVMVVEGLFDYAVLWQAGFRNLTCAMGTQLNAHQFRQLCGGPRTVYLAFDADANGSGPQAARHLAGRLSGQGVVAFLATLPEGLDPNSFFTHGGDAHQFHALLETARR